MLRRSPFIVGILLVPLVLGGCWPIHWIANAMDANMPPPERAGEAVIRVSFAPPSTPSGDWRVQVSNAGPVGVRFFTKDVERCLVRDSQASPPGESVHVSRQSGIGWDGVGYVYLQMYMMWTVVLMPVVFLMVIAGPPVESRITLYPGQSHEYACRVRHSDRVQPHWFFAASSIDAANGVSVRVESEPAYLRGPIPASRLGEPRHPDPRHPAPPPIPMQP